MSTASLSKNLASLKKLDPALYARIAPLNGSKKYEVTQSKSGPPSLTHTDSRGIKKRIHSNYDPVGESSRYLETSNICESINFIVLGLGLGYQVMEIIRQTSNRAKIYIFEKDPELFALAMREVDFSLIFEHPGVKLFVDANPLGLGTLLEPEQINFTLNKYCLVRQRPLVDGNWEYYGVLLGEIENYFKESQINFKTQSIHSKLYYKNIFSNFSSLLESSGITSFKDCLPDIPTIICSAGPSLDKNIQLLKSARERFFLIAVATALKPLLHNGIQPDVVISIDPDELTINSFDFLTDTSDFLLVYNQAVPNAIPKAFPNNRIAFDSEVYLAKWFKKQTEEKGNLGKISSVAHAALKFSQFLACSPIILVGQDLSFFQQRMHCLHSFYHEERMDKVARLNPRSYWERMKYLNFGPNLTHGMDLFGKRVASTLAMESYNYIFSKNFEGSQNIINSTEGGVPIEGAINISLRESLYVYCRKLVKDKQNLLSAPHLSERNSLKSLQDSVSRQIQLLKDISGKLNALELNYLNSRSPGPEGKQSFINEMGILYEDILENKETAFLLQGYDFAGFSDWYRSNCQILRKKELSEDCSLLDEEFERDLKFFDVLVGSVDYLMVNFEKALSQ